MEVKYKDWGGEVATIQLKPITEILNQEELTGIIDLMKRDPYKGAQMLSTLFMNAFNSPEDFQYLVMSEKADVVDEVATSWLESSLEEVMTNKTKIQLNKKELKTNDSGWVVALALIVSFIGTLMLVAGGIAILFSQITNPLGWIFTGVFGFASITIIGYIVKEVIKNLMMENK